MAEVGSEVATGTGEDIVKVAENLAEFYEKNPTTDKEKVGKLKTTATAFNAGVREDQKVTDEHLEKAKKVLGVTSV